VPTLRSAVPWNGGQTCDAQSRILVDRAIDADVVDALTEFAQVKIGAGVEDHDLGPLVSEVQHERVLALAAAARDAGGARVVTGGGHPEGLDDGWFFEPTIFDVTDPATPIAKHEVFGPVLTIVPFPDEREAVRIADGVRYDLAAAVWTKDIDRAFRLASQIRAGQVHINSWGSGRAWSSRSAYTSERIRPREGPARPHRVLRASDDHRASGLWALKTRGVFGLQLSGAGARTPRLRFRLSRVAGGVAAPGCQGSRRDSLPSAGSSDRR
jgi:hypothetical protein